MSKLRNLVNLRWRMELQFHRTYKVRFYAPIMDIIKVVQINLHHSRAASALVCRKMLADNIDVVLIQEPWLSGGENQRSKMQRGLYN